MRVNFVLILMVAFFIQVSAASYAQKFSYFKNTTSLKELLKEIELQTDYNVFYNSEELKDTKPIRARFNNADLTDVLKYSFENQPVVYIIKNKTIIVKRKEGVKKSGKITGTVTDDKKQPLPGVSVKVKNTQIATISNESGVYTLTVPEETSILVFTYIGFETKEISVGKRSIIDVVLKERITELVDAIVVGYSTVSRKDLTGAVSSVGARQLKDIPVNSAAEALAGRLAGVQVTTSEGGPNADVRIQVRGGGSITQDNSPLYIIDGVQVENGLTTLSPQDIQSIDVLKDAASTAIYGARGANGVIIVTTKGGREMQKTTVNYSNIFGVRQLANKLEVMNPYEFVTYQYERVDSTTYRRTYGVTYPDRSVYLNTSSVDWQDVMFGRNAEMQTHNVSITGGTKLTTFNLSATSNGEEGVMINSDFKRTLLNFKFDHKVTDRFKVGLNLRYNYQKTFGGGTSAEGLGTNSKLRHAIKYRPFLLDQDLTVDDLDEDYYNLTNSAGNGLFIINPIQLSNGEYRSSKSQRVNLGGFINYDFNKFFYLRATGGYDNNVQRSDTFDDVITPAARLYGSQPVVSVNNLNVSSFNESIVLNFSNAALKNSFSKKHSIKALIGQETYQYRSQGDISRLRYFPVGITPEKALGQLNLGTTVTGSPTTSNLENRITSFFSQVNYSLNKKYLATFTIRGDGSTKFAKGHQWGYFPSGSLSWKLSEERFIKDLGFISDLKLRGSYGISGNNRIGDYLYTSLFDAINSSYGLNEQLMTGYKVSTLANPNLKWESTLSKNLGLDFGILNDRLQLTVDAYRNDTRDLLIRVPIPGDTGYKTQLQNVGSTRNQGIEFQLNAALINKRDFRWSINFNTGFNVNKIRSLSSGLDYYYENSGWGISSQLPDYIVKVGEPVGSMYGFVTDGFYKPEDFNYDPSTKIYTLKEGQPDNTSVVGIPQPGALKFKDLDGDNVITAEKDQRVIGNANPKFTGGIFQQFTYKQFDLSVFLNLSVGNDILNANKIEFTNGYNQSTNMLSMMNGRWSNIDENGNYLVELKAVSGKQVVSGESPEVLNEKNRNATIWQPLKATSGAFALHSWAIEDGSFLRINNITLGYSMPAALLKKLKIKGLRVYSTVNNLAIFTNYSGYDPEVNTRRSTPVTPGVDYSAYPRSRAFLVGANLTF